MKLVIFGANGQTGRLATALALNAGHHVVAHPPCERFPLAADTATARRTVIVSTTEDTPSLWQMIRREAGSGENAGPTAATAS
jgi:hypothetical protein